MIIAQVLLIIPIITGITMAAIKDRGRLIKNTAYTLGAGKIQMLWTLIREFRTSIGSSLIAGYGRAISEVGAVMLVGGNIKGYTRVMTTAIVLETNMGNFDQAIAIGIVLLALFFVINIFLQKFQGHDLGYKCSGLKKEYDGVKVLDIEQAVLCRGALHVVMGPTARASPRCWRLLPGLPGRTGAVFYMATGKRTLKRCVEILRWLCSALIFSKPACTTT